MKYGNVIKKGILAELVMLTVLACLYVQNEDPKAAISDSVIIEGIESVEGTGNEENGQQDYIKWVDFTVSYEALCQAYEADVKSYGKDTHVDWIDLLAYGAARSGGEFNKQALKNMQELESDILSGNTTIEQTVKDMKYYPYYREAYQAALGGMVGEYLIQETDDSGAVVWRKKYGIKAFSPIAKGFPYSDFDDFGSSRSYGYKRPHLGHDMMGQIGTPVAAVESGVVEALGWNQYGGWRIGIRSFDGKRYYYYAHLRQDYPYAEGLEQGSVVTAGDIIGYMGHTGYSKTENVNNIKTVHLHWGLELVFNESQKESNNEIWIDCYQLSRFLYKNRSEATKQEGSREWKRIYDMEDPAVDEYLQKQNAESLDSVSGNSVSGNSVSGNSVSGNLAPEPEEVFMEEDIFMEDVIYLEEDR